MAQRAPRNSGNVRREYENAGERRPRPQSAERAKGPVSGPSRSGQDYQARRAVPPARRAVPPAGKAAPYSQRPVQKKPVRRRRKSHAGLIAAILIAVVLIAGGAVAAIHFGIFQKPEEIVEIIKPVPAAPKVVRTATIGATGDILMHTPILTTHETWDGYEFDSIFSRVAPIYQQTDLMIANLEVTLGGEESGEYRGYPTFNCPDEIVPALKNAGVDICLTANNHANDTGYFGIMRTLEVLDDYGIDHVGSRESTDEPWILTRNVNGIRLGMVCYTYDTREITDWELSLNGIPLSEEGVRQMHTFSYEALDEFYAEVQQQLDFMDMLNVDSKIVFLHWGTEYQEFPNDYQVAIAQQLCEMGVDVIIGGHPHVIQRFDTLRSSTGHETVCLYSMGNEISNQRIAYMDGDGADQYGNEGYTEDGLVMQVTFEKFNNGNVKVGAVNIVPTWVQLDGNGYQIIGLPQDVSPWDWGTTDTFAAIASYNRTLDRLSEAYPAYRQSKHQEELLTYIE